MPKPEGQKRVLHYEKFIFSAKFQNGLVIKRKVVRDPAWPSGLMCYERSKEEKRKGMPRFESVLEWNMRNW